MYENTPESARDILKAVRSRDIAGVAVFRRLLFGTPFQPLFEELHKAGVPVLAALNDCEGAADASVNFNDAAGGYEAMRQLIENGHRKILIVHGPLQRNQIEYRCQGALDYLSDHNLSGRVHLESYRVHHYTPTHLRGIMDILRPRRRNPALNPVGDGVRALTALPLPPTPSPVPLPGPSSLHRRVAA